MSDSLLKNNNQERNKWKFLYYVCLGFYALANILPFMRLGPEMKIGLIILMMSSALIIPTIFFPLLLMLSSFLVILGIGNIFIFTVMFFFKNNKIIRWGLYLQLALLILLTFLIGGLDTLIGFYFFVASEILTCILLWNLSKKKISLEEVVNGKGPRGTLNEEFK